MRKILGSGRKHVKSAGQKNLQINSFGFRPAPWTRYKIRCKMTCISGFARRAGIQVRRAGCL